MVQLKRYQGIAAGTAVGIGIAGMVAPAAHAADLTVTSVTGGVNEDGSFLNAIKVANQTPETEDRILFQSGLSGNLVMTSRILLQGPVYIQGPGADKVTITGDPDYGILYSDSNTKISGLTFANGNGQSFGGAMDVENADLSLDDVVVKGSVAEQGGGGIYVLNGNLTIENSTVTGNSVANTDAGQPGGGGMWVNGDSTLKISNSEISNNTAGQAGGISSVGPTSIDSSLISGNKSVTGIGGGMMVGSVLPSTGSSITNSTITENESATYGAGLVSIRNELKVASSTITGNTALNPSSSPVVGTGPTKGAGWLHLGGPATLENSIVSGNSPADIGTSPDLTFPIPIPAATISGSFNLTGDATNAKFTDTVPGSNITSTNPQLGALADNGGPTRTMLPADSSPAVDKGSSGLKTDQRGQTRPIDLAGFPDSSAAGANGADIGAVELQSAVAPPPPPPPTRPSNEFTFGKVKLNKKKGVATLQVKVPGAGKAQVIGSKTVAASSKTVKGKSTINLTVKAKGKAAKSLKKKGKVKVKASVKFSPTGGEAKTQSKTVKLVKAKKKKN